MLLIMSINLQSLFKKYKNHFFLIGANFFGILAVFVSFKLINLTTNEATLGVFSLIVVYKQIVAKVINFGLPTFALKHIAKNREELSIADITKFYSKTLGVIIFNAFVCIVLLGVTVLILGDLLFKNFSNLEICLLALMAPIYAIILYNAQILRARKYFINFQLLNGSLTYGLFCLLLLAAYLNDISVQSVPLLFFICLAIVFIFSFIILKIKVRLIESFKEAFNAFHNYIGKLKEGVHYFAVQMSSQGLNWVTLIYTSSFIGEIDTGGLNIIIRLAALCGFFKTVINSIKGPDYAFLYHSDKINNLNSEIKFNTKLLVFVAIPFLSILFIFPEFFLGLFSDDYGHLTTVFRIVLIAAVIDNVFGSVGLLMQMTQEEKRFKNIMLTTVLIHLAIGFLLTFYFKVQGLAISLLIAALFWNVVSAFILKRKHQIKSYFHV